MKGQGIKMDSQNTSRPIKEKINGEWYMISKRLLKSESSRSQSESMQDNNYNNSQQLLDGKDRDNSKRPQDTNVNTEDVKHNYNFLCLKDTWIGKDKTTGKYGCCGCDCC